MCDRLVKEKLSKKEIPQYVYKRVQKVGNGKYVTPVMGEPLYKGSWKGAKNYTNPEYSLGGLIKHLQTKFKKSYWPSSSKWVKHHAGRWASFKTLKDAKYADLISNFVENEIGGNCYTKKFPTIVVKCEIRGDVSAGSFDSRDTYLSTHIRVIEEVTNEL